MTMPCVGGFRRRLSALVLRYISLGIYLGGATLLLSGLIFASQAWWRLVHQHAGVWAISATTAEVFVTATAFFLILIVPLQHHRTDERHATAKLNDPAPKRVSDPLEKNSVAVR